MELLFDLSLTVALPWTWGIQLLCTARCKLLPFVPVCFAGRVPWDKPANYSSLCDIMLLQQPAHTGMNPCTKSISSALRLLLFLSGELKHD